MPELIERIKSGIEVNGEFELQLIDQMAIINSRLNIADLCEEKGWITKEEEIGTSVTISGENK